MNFIVPTDFSINAKNAAKYAAILAQATNSNIRLFHILEPPLIGTDKLDPIYKGKVSLAKTEAAIKLEKLCNELKEEYVNIKCDYVMRVAENSSEIIVSVALNNKADFIIMGTRGAGLIKKTFLGSNTASVIEDSQIPVLVIPEKVSLLRPKKIVFASEFRDSDVNAIKQLSEIASSFDAEVIIVHIVENKNEAESEFPTIDFFSAQVQKATTYSKISYRIFKSEKVETGIELFIDSVGADIIALSTRDRNPFEKLFSKSITKELSFHSKIPLLAFHVKNNETEYDI
jgi:nucleotide-binding universal stress UspA family protein